MTKKILVTGGSGLVGKALEHIVRISGEDINDWTFINSKNYDLSLMDETIRCFTTIRPNVVIHLAACVGGLFKNMNNKVEMLEKNLMINYNVLKCAYVFKVSKVISCLSTCIFPDKTTYPINEKMLHDGPPHKSNDAYAYAKRMLEIQSRAYQENYDKNFICIIPTNIYGPYDNYSLEDGHVVPALIHRCYLAKQNGEDFIVKGTGRPLRQFLYSEDLGKIIIDLMDNYYERDPIIIAPNEKDEISIGQIARYIAKCFDYEDRIQFDVSYSDGQYKKTADNSKLRNYLPNFKFIDIKTGIQKSVEWFVQNYEAARK